MADAALQPRSAFAGLLVAAGNGRGVTVIDRDGLGLATLASRRGRLEELSAAIRNHFGIELPAGPARTVSGAVAMAGTSPGIWLASRERGANGFAAELRAAAGAAASVTDQSDGYGVLRVQGQMVRTVLAKLVPVDLHARAFPVGRCASSIASHMGVTFWRLEDAGGWPVFEIAVFRSLAASFWRALSESAAEYGLAIAGESRAR